MEVKTISNFSDCPNSKTHSFKRGYSLTIKSRQVALMRSFISNGCITTAQRYKNGMKAMETERIRGESAAHGGDGYPGLAWNRLTGTIRNGRCEKLTLGSGKNGCVSNRVSPRERGSTPQQYQVWTWTHPTECVKERELGR